MYPEAAIKASFPKALGHKVKIANKVSSVFDKPFHAKFQSHEQRCDIRPHAHWLSICINQHAKFTSKTCDEKRGNTFHE
jgi:hypothetical protein